MLFSTDGLCAGCCGLHLLSRRLPTPATFPSPSSIYRLANTSTARLAPRRNHPVNLSTAQGRSSDSVNFAPGANLLHGRPPDTWPGTAAAPRVSSRGAEADGVSASRRPPQQRSQASHQRQLLQGGPPRGKSLIRAPGPWTRPPHVYPCPSHLAHPSILILAEAACTVAAVSREPRSQRQVLVELVCHARALSTVYRI